jgi:NAD(P)-dependent dehydrogenase (short-subunit alcohol dehydrogenase family)
MAAPRALKDMDGRHALVTGAGSGIGEATVHELALRGARVSLVDIDAKGATRVAADVRAGGGDAASYVVDVASAEQVDELAARAVKERGPVDLLVNNAGVAVVAPFTKTRGEDWEWMSGVNMWGPLRLTRALLPDMIARGRGHVVVVASLAGLIGAPGMVAYSTTKFAMVGFAEALRLELAGTGVGVTAICPGYVHTNLHKATRYDNPGFKAFLDAPPSWYGMTSERVAIELADAVLHDRGLVVLGPEKVGWWLKRFAPSAALAVSRWVATRAGVRGDARGAQPRS